MPTDAELTRCSDELIAHGWRECIEALREKMVAGRGDAPFTQDAAQWCGAVILLERTMKERENG